MKLSERLKRDAEYIWNKIYTHPFIKELFEGTLPLDKFKFYIIQDYNYLIGSIKNFSLLASKADDVNIMRDVVEMAYMESRGEFKGYENFLEKLNLTMNEAENVQQIPELISYLGFLLSTSSLKSFEEGITAILPCYWSYAEIARIHKEKLIVSKNELYKEWAYTYLEDDYIRLVDKIKKLVDDIKHDFPYNKLKHVFITSSKYEYMFWDSVYHIGNKTI
jgi:thiaminase/transcriptional activator TenA